MLKCGFSEKELLDFWLEVDEAWRRAQSAPQGVSHAGQAVCGNLHAIYEAMRQADIGEIVINGVFVECYFGQGPDGEEGGGVLMRSVPTVLMSSGFHRETIDSLNPKKD